MSGKREVVLILAVEGPNVFGELEVTGFVTEGMALDLAMPFSDALRWRFPEARVAARVERRTGE